MTLINIRNLGIVLSAPLFSRLNLVVNASESLSGPGGKIRVTSTIAPREGNRRWWRLEVTDEGVGMDARTVARIFDPFFTTKPRGQGTGLGLSISSEIARRHGGSLKLGAPDAGRRTGPRGATFVLSLPLGR